VDLKQRLTQFRAEEQNLAWEGTFLDYFEMAQVNPHVANLAHARIHSMIMTKGVDVGQRDQRVFNFFKEDIFGLERPLEQLVEYFNSAAKRLEVRKRILLLMGPVGGGKSTLVALLKRGMERFSRTDEGALYAIKGWPLQGEPRHQEWGAVRRACTIRRL
jgi:serine protein kinase